MTLYPKAIENLINELAKLPSIGRKSAQRMAYYIVDMESSRVEALITALTAVKQTIHPCPVCGNLTDQNECQVCQDSTRNRSLIAVVEDATSIIALERTKNYKGLYHVLGGMISPRDNISPNELNVTSLINRVKNPEVKEVILAISPTIEGEITMHFLKELLKDNKLLVTRLAQGVPLGVNLENYDEVSFYRALEERKKI